MKTALQLLEEAKATIQDPKQWTQNTFARDKSGRDVNSKNPTAVCWCSLGAINRIEGDGEHVLASRLLDKAAGMNVAGFNDFSTHEEVLAMWDKAIELARR